MQALEVGVIIPALNEEQALPLVLQDLSAVPLKGLQLRPIVVDNGSTDATPRLAREGGALVLREDRRGYGQACLTGLAHLAQNPPDIVVFLDGDHSDYTEDLPTLLAPILSGRADLVLGDRTALAISGALLPQQRFGNALATSLIHWQTGTRFKDMGPFRAIRWGALQELKMSDPTWGWNVEMQMRSLQQGLRVCEVPVRYRPRVGDSKISGTLRGTLRAGTRILWAVWHYR